MLLAFLLGALLTEHLPESLSIVHLAQRIDMVGEGKRVDLCMYISIVIA